MSPARVAVVLSLALVACSSEDGGAASSTSGGPDATTDGVAPDGSSGGPDAATDGAIADSPAPIDAADAAPLGPLVAYASGYGPSIVVYSVGANGALNAKGTTNAFGASPSFLAVRPGSTHLYAIDEATAGKVGAYAIDRTSGALTFLNSVSTQGNGPAFVSVDGTGKWAMVANYGDGTIAVLPIQADGKLGDATYTQNVGANAHMIVADPSNQFVFVPCLSADYVAQFHLDATQGKLTPNATPTIASAAGAGPRHIAFHPNGKLAYVINEKASTITAYTLDTTSGQLATVESKSTLPAGFTGTNTGAEVWVHPSGAYVYGSNRGDDSIVQLSIDVSTGKMTLVGHTKTGGTMPRSFTLEPGGAFLYAANQGSNNVVPFAIDATKGTLTATASPVTLTSPSFVGVVHLPAP